MKLLIKYLSTLAIGRMFAETAPAGPGNAYLGSPNGQRRERNRKRHHRSIWGLQTTIVGIFGHAQDLDRAVERLARAGFEDTVYDVAIVAREAVNSGGSVVFAPGYAPAVVWGSAEPALPSQPDRHAVARTFKAHLADYDLPDEVIEAYARTFYHNGEFVLVRTDNERAEQAMEILRECGATQVNRHD
jgi:hypothetical protein